jgi:hypothetical protein
MIYAPQGQTITVDLSKISGTSAVGWWFDPLTGVATCIKGSVPTTGAKTFRPPSNGPERDWILVLDDEGKGFSTPGEALMEKRT